MVDAAAGDDRRLLQRAQARRRLARVEDLRAGALDRAHAARRQRRDARQALQEVQRGALGGRAARGRRRSRAAPAPAARATRPSGPSRSSCDVGIERAERRLGGVEAEHDAGRLLGDRRDGARARRRRSPGSSRRRRRRPRRARGATSSASVCASGLMRRRRIRGRWSCDDRPRRLAARSRDHDVPQPHGGRRRPTRCGRAARSVRLDQTRTIGHLVRWRIPGVPPDQSFMGLLSEDPFTLLDEGPHHAISGLCGRIWTLSRDYGDLAGPDDFRAWNEPRTVRVAVRALGHGRIPAAASSTLLQRGARRPRPTGSRRCACARCGSRSGRSSA